MSISTKPIAMIFGTILLVVTGEIAYIFLYPQMVNKKISVTPTPIPTPSSAIGYIVDKTDPNQAISPEVYVGFIYNLPRFKKGILTESTEEDTFEGKITNLIYRENAQGEAKKLLFTLEGSEGYTNYFQLSANTVDKDATWKQADGSPFSYKNLQVGDKIRIDSTFNLLEEYGQNRMSMQITKL